jgi:uncharacterized protein YgbK (DUF1537 family)
MPIKIAAIADDYTGASDLANTWRKDGLKTIQTIGVPTRSLEERDAEAIVIALKIRSVPASQAVSSALEADRWLRSRGAGHVMYKICSTFDSTDAGNIGPVTDALRKQAGADWTLVTPAFPETGRTVYRGHLFVGDVPLSESPLRHHPLNPMRDSNLVRVLSKQTPEGVGGLNVQTIRAGRSACTARIRQLVSEGAHSIVADAIEEQDLEVLGDIAIGNAVSTGASGLGLGLARAVLKSSDRRKDTIADLEPVSGLSAVLVGSCSARTLEQLAAAERTMPVLRLDPAALISAGGDTAAALDWAATRLQGGPVVISAAGTPQEVADIQKTFGTAAAGQAIERALASIAEKLAAMGVRRLVVAGGETSGAVVDRLGIQGFQVGAELAPGVPMLRTIGRAGGELCMALKSGNFGGVDFFADALSRMK